jgi:4-diphosphocytidyl-2-C-methyl-D-erythritol kinase
LLAEGYGERLSAPPALPELAAVLVNPRAPSPTAEVYKCFDELGARGSCESPTLPEFGLADVEAFAAFLETTRNDLEAPAAAIQPKVLDVLARLRAAPETLIARMSGSGATCFALCRSAAEAGNLARRLETAAPQWWVRACRLGGDFVADTSR